jgi:hypothetical protein
MRSAARLKARSATHSSPQAVIAADNPGQSHPPKPGNATHLDPTHHRRRVAADGNTRQANQPVAPIQTGKRNEPSAQPAILEASTQVSHHGYTASGKHPFHT